jgi:hypothetical protein
MELTQQSKAEWIKEEVSLQLQSGLCPFPLCNETQNTRMEYCQRYKKTFQLYAGRENLRKNETRAETATR